VNDLLFITKVQAGQFALSHRPVDLRDLAAQCLEAATPAAGEKGIDLTLDAPRVPELNGDPDRLAQLLDNLVSNAVKYTPEGERVEVSLAAQGNTLVLEVTNTGVHIPANELNLLFERFYRASTATADQAQGVGLGLTIAKAIAKAHNGEIHVSSDTVRGTTFQVVLPILEGPVASDPRHQPSSAVA
jgi:signal transduction histidine kinase